MNKVSKAIVNYLGVMFTIFLIATFFYSIYAKMIDKSSYTDWISAFCNVVMAGTTVAAVFTARNYLAQFTAQEGYKIAIELVNDFFPKIKKINFEKTIDNLNHFDELKTNLFSSDSIDDALYVMSGQVNLLLESKNIIKIYNDELSEYLYKIGTYGLIPSDNMGEHINNLKVNIEKLLMSFNELIMLMNQCHSLGSELYRIWWVRVDEVEKREHGKKLLASFNEINLKQHRITVSRCVENIQNDYQKFMNIGHSITKIFVVK